MSPDVGLYMCKCHSFILHIQVDDVRVRATGKAVALPEPGDLEGDPGPLPAPATRTSAYFEVGPAARAACVAKILIHSSLI